MNLDYVQVPSMTGPARPTGSNPSMPINGMSFEPQRMTCPYCLSEMVTFVRYENGSLTWALCMMFAYSMCCWVPFCCDSTKDVQHECPSCSRTIGHARKCF